MIGLEQDKAALKKGLISWGIKGVLYKIYVMVVLMLSAGRWNWTAGWLYVVIFLLFDLATAVVVIPRNPELLIERSRAYPGAKSWDKIIMPLASGFLPLISWVLAGLNDRFDWTPFVDEGIQIGGLVFTALGHALIVWSMAANKFFSPLVRIQEERGHRVADRGPYRFLRHPGYLGAIIFSISIPLLLGSLWALIPGIGSMVLYIIRTHLEDLTLNAELPGYQEYSQSTRSRLLPGIW